MSVARVNFSKLPFLGAFALATDKVVIIADSFEKIPQKEVNYALKLDPARANIGGSPLIGILAAGNSSGIIVPGMIEGEVDNFREKIGVKATVIPGKHTALGNMVLANDNGALVDPELNSETVEMISEVLNVPVNQGTIAGIKTVGAVAIATNKGVVLHPNTTEKELKVVEDTLKVPADIGTAVGGIKYLGICGVANSNGALVGAPTTGPELGRIENTLGLI